MVITLRSSHDLGLAFTFFALLNFMYTCEFWPHSLVRFAVCSWWHLQRSHVQVHSPHPGQLSWWGLPCESPVDSNYVSAYTSIFVKQVGRQSLQQKILSMSKLMLNNWVQILCVCFFWLLLNYILTLLPHGIVGNLYFLYHRSLTFSLVCTTQWWTGTRGPWIPRRSSSDGGET